MDRPRDALPPVLMTCAARSWMAFSVTAFVMAAAASVADGDHPLKSDDPYIIGSLAGSFAALLALAATATRALDGSVARQRGAYFVLLVAVPGALLLFDLLMPPVEGQGIASLLACAVAMGGLGAYPLLALPLTPRSMVLTSIPGVLVLIGYIIVVRHMS